MLLLVAELIIPLPLRKTRSLLAFFMPHPPKRQLRIPVRHHGQPTPGLAVMLAPLRRHARQAPEPALMQLLPCPKFLGLLLA